MSKALLLIVALLLSGCEYRVFIGGDSQAAGVKSAGLEGSTQGGCGWTDEGMGYPGPCLVPLGNPTGSEYVALFVSLWDIGQPDLSGYSDAQAHYESFGLPIVWVAMKPSQEVVWATEDGAGLNERVAAELGCTLVPWSVRDVPSFMLYSDGVHYTLQGGLIVALRLELTVDEATYGCVA